MKALTLRQPWAWAIAYADKDIENRTWRTSYRGPLWIHAGHGWDADAVHAAPMVQAWDRFGSGRRSPLVPAAVQRCAIIAVALLVDCHLSDCDSDQCCQPWGQPQTDMVRGRDHHWVLRNVTPLSQPVECPGRLGLWNVPAEVAARVRDRFGPAQDLPWQAEDRARETFWLGDKR